MRARRARNKRDRKRAHGGNSDVNNVKKKRDYCDTRKLSQKSLWDLSYFPTKKERGRKEAE